MKKLLNLNSNGDGFKLESLDLDVADVIMYALDNGKHDIHISCYKDNTLIHIFPIKEKEND